MPEKVKIRVAVALEFITIERTSGCLLIHKYTCDLTSGRTETSCSIAIGERQY